MLYYKTRRHGQPPCRPPAGRPLQYGAMVGVAVLGAGDLGGALAHKLAARDRVRSVCLIDASREVAAAKALDIRQAGPIERFGTRVTAGTLDAVVGTGVVVVADPAGPPGREEFGTRAVPSRVAAAAADPSRVAAAAADPSPAATAADPAPGRDAERDPAWAWTERIVRLAGSAPIVCADADGGRLVARSVRELGIGRTRILGSASEALVASLRAVIALEADVSPAQVAIEVTGTPPTHPVAVWSGASVGGCRLEDRLSPPALTRVRRRFDRLWPPGFYALASAAVRVVEAIAAGGSRRTFTCFVAGDAGRRTSAAAVAVTLHAGGVDEVVTPRLSPSERVRLDNALQSER